MQEVIAPNGYILNAQGHFVPKHTMSNYEELKDELVKELIIKAEQISSTVEDLRKHTMSEVGALLATARDKYGIKAGGKRGNISIKSFDGKYLIQISVQDFLTFDERLNLAKELIDTYLKRLTENSPKELQMLISQAFEVDKKGRVTASKILPLMKLKIENEDWKKAMHVIRESLSVESTKNYVRFKKRNELTGEMEPIHLDIAKL